jgi:transposase-like protein
LDEIYALIDSGQVPLEGKDGLIQQMIKAGLERGLQTELTEHVGYEKGDPEAGLTRTPATARSRRRWRPASATSSWRCRATGMARSRRC